MTTTVKEETQVHIPEEAPPAPLAELERPSGSRSSDDTIYDEYGLTPGQYALLLKTICAGAPREMAGFFLMYCKRNNLDPFAKDVYLMETSAWDKTIRQYVPRWQIVSGIAGLRKIASRSPLYQGQTPPEWTWAKEKVTERNPATGEERTTWEVVLDSDGLPARPVQCRVGVYRKGCKEPFWGDVLYREFVQTKDGSPIGQWKTSPTNQLSVRGEAQALRKGFPEEVGGLYLEEELAGATDEQLADMQRAQAEAGTVIEQDPLDDEINAAIATLGWKRARVEIERKKFAVKQDFLAHLETQLEAVRVKAQRGTEVAPPVQVTEPVTDSGSGEGAARTAPTPAELLMSDAQKRKLFACLGQLGIKEKPERLIWAEQNGVVTDSFSKLTEEQARGLIDAAEKDIAALEQQSTPVNEAEEPCPACLALPGDRHFVGCPEA